MRKLKDDKSGKIDNGLGGKVALAIMLAIGLFVGSKFVGGKTVASNNYIQFTKPDVDYATKAEYDYYYNVRLDELVVEDKMNIDKDKPLNVQFIKDTLSVDDYLKTYSLDKIRHNHAIVSYIYEEDAAWLSEKKIEEVEKRYNTYIAELEKLANTQNKKFNKLIKDKFSKQMDENVLKDIVMNNIVSQMYLEEKMDSRVSKDEIDKFYNENKDSFTAKKYMYYDISFDDLEEKEEAEKEALEMFDYITDVDSFVDTIKTVDKRIQDKIKEEDYTDEDIVRDFTNIVTINDASNFTKEWLYEVNEEGNMISPNSSAILTSAAGDKKDRGVYRVVFFIENVEDYEEVAWNFDKIFISKKIEGENAQQQVVDVLKELEATNKDNYEEVFDKVIESIGHNKASVNSDEYRYRDVKSRVLIDEGYGEIVSFLENSRDFEHNTVESEEGFVIVINRGRSVVGYEDEVISYIKDIKRNEFLGDVYKYSENFKLVAGKDKQAYLKVNLDMYKENSNVDKILEAQGEKE